jgi:hypothetical protein
MAQNNDTLKTGPVQVIPVNLIIGGVCMYFTKEFEPYFISTGFIDLLPLALKLAGQAGYGGDEIIEAICKVADKHREYPPRKNRTAWFACVFKEKLHEARADLLRRNYLRSI